MNNRARHPVKPAMQDNAKTCGVMLALLALLVPAGEAAARPRVTKQEEARLNKWEVLEYSEKVSGSKIAMGKAIGIIDDIPEAVVYVMEDVAKYKHFLPRIKGSRVVKRQGPHTYAVLETDFPWPVKDAWAYVRFTRQKLKGRTYVIRWGMRNGTLKSFGGTALVEVWSKKGGVTRTSIIYKLLAEPKTSIPDSKISKGVMHITAAFVHRIRMRLQALRKFKKLPPQLKKR